MILLGIDPGTRITGYGAIKKDGRKITHIDNGIIAPKQKLTFAEKLFYIYNKLADIICEIKPDEVALEEIFVASNARSALLLGHARGVAMLAAAAHNIKVYEYSSRVIKQALVGYGNADKNQVAMMTKRLLGLPEVATQDASDALAVAICHAHTNKIG